MRPLLGPTTGTSAAFDMHCRLWMDEGYNCPVVAFLNYSTRGQKIRANVLADHHANVIRRHIPALNCATVLH